MGGLDSAPSTVARDERHDLLVHHVTSEFEEVNVAVAVWLSSLQSILTRVCDHIVALIDGDILHHATLVSEHKSEEFFGGNVEGTLADSASVNPPHSYGSEGS